MAVVQAKEFTCQQLAGIGVDSLETEANFIVTKLPSNLDQRYFRQKKILVRRPFNESFLRGYTRITVGNKYQMSSFIEVVKEGMDI